MAVRINGYLIDAAISVVLELEAEPSSYPVESGSDFTDNVRALPRRLMIEGVVSDSPLGAVARERRGPSGTDVTIPSAEARAVLIQIHEAREPVPVETDSTIYNDMVLFRLSIPDDAAQGQALRFTGEFQRLRVQENQRVAVRVSTPRAARKRDLGTQTPQAIDPRISAFADPKTGVPTRVKYDPESGRYVNADTGKPLTQSQIDAWLAQNGGDPYYRSPRELGPGASSPTHRDNLGGGDVGTANEGPPPYWPGYVDPFGEKLDRDALLNPGGVGDHVSDPGRVLDPAVSP